jgi:DNA-binding transcriptional LysR family regulator
MLTQGAELDRLKLMDTFAAVVRFGSYTRTAGELGVSRAIVSKRIQELEDDLGIKLLNRNTHSISVTAAGSDYFEDCKTLLAQHAALDDRMRARRGDPRGLLKILVTKTFGEAILARVVAEFSHLYPKISVQMMLSHWDMGPHGDLVTSGYDVIIRTLRDRDSALVAREIVTLPRVLVATPEYLEKHGCPQSPKDLTRHNCLYPRPNSSSVWEFDGPNGHESIRVSGFPRANSSFAIRHAARNHLGIASLIEYLAVKELNSGRFVRVLKPYTPQPRKLHVIYQKDSYQPLRTRVFIDFLVKRMKAFSVDVSKDSATPPVKKKAIAN